MIVLKNIKKMSKISTAEEFVTRGHLWVGDDKDVNDLAKSHIEFAKLHVEAALKEAEIAGQNNWGNSKKMKDAILNSYLLENIK